MSLSAAATHDHDHDHDHEDGCPDQKRQRRGDNNNIDALVHRILISTTVLRDLHVTFAQKNMPHGLCEKGLPAFSGDAEELQWLQQLGELLVVYNAKYDGKKRQQQQYANLMKDMTWTVCVRWIYAICLRPVAERKQLEFTLDDLFAFMNGCGDLETVAKIKSVVSQVFGSAFWESLLSK